MPLDLPLFQHLLEATPDAVLLVGEDGCIVHANASVHTVFGYQPADLVGQSIELLVPPHQRQAHVVQREDFQHDRRARPMGTGMVVHGLHADGHTVPLDVQLARLNHNGQPYTVAIARNIGHILRLQEKLAHHTQQLETSLANSELQRVRLQELDSEKNRVLGVAAHDLRNPLSALRVFTDLLEDGALGPVSDAYSPLIQRISRSVDYMSSLVDQLLDWSAIESGQLVLDARSLALSEVVEGALEVERLAARSRAVDIVSELDPVCTIHGDRAKLEQVVHNLVGNAVRHSPAAGRVQVFLRQRAERVVLRVSDQGPGISTEDRERIFRPFSQGRDPHLKGVGLGLAIVSRIVAAHGGSTSVEDSPGGGATFVVQLPRPPQQAELPAGPPP